MTVKEVIHVLLERHDMTQQDLAEKLELESRSNISVPLSRNGGQGMRVDTLIRWLDALDANLVVQPCDGDVDDEMVLFGEW